jgi:hypothetical protein
MPYYMVWGAQKRPQGFMGGKFLDWSKPPVGIFEAENADKACLAAAHAADDMGTFFAVEGNVWGMALVTPEATELGRTNSDVGSASINNRLSRIEQLSERLAKLQLGSGEE